MNEINPNPLPINTRLLNAQERPFGGDWFKSKLKPSQWKQSSPGLNQIDYDEHREYWFARHKENE